MLPIVIAQNFVGTGLNLTDDMMKVLEKLRVVLRICFYDIYVIERNPTLEDFVQHILHVIDVIGDEHVGISSDYDGVSLLIFRWLSKTPYDSKTFKKFGNV
ncbi:membrane dipeptidase [Coxiella-like endosymbiont]|uniref:membrane dipeptidase n=1 Tax=Coxiella-like endosymbiont TaxID=1592897 RepID=UPI00272D422C|nr:membrane dipeptidase [Coxiella-like endosymbiont]